MLSSAANGTEYLLGEVIPQCGLSVPDASEMGVPEVGLVLESVAQCAIHAGSTGRRPRSTDQRHGPLQRGSQGVTAVRGLQVGESLLEPLRPS
jgi:hypothetical protein